MTPRIGSLCSGAGALDMALEAFTGGRTVWHVENDGVNKKGQIVGARRVLAARYPDVPNYLDVKALDYAALEPIELLAAGYPCQPFSDAGLRLGEADARHLWPYVADTIGALRPRGVLLENVRGHLGRGLSTVLADLANLGYDASWGVVRASDAGAPHRRERVFIVAQDADRAARGERWLAAPGQAPGGRAWPDSGGRGGAPAPDSGAGRWGSRLDDLRQGQPDVAGRAAEAVADTDCGGREEHSERDGRTLRDRLDDSAQRDDTLGRLLDWSVYEPAIRRWEHVLGRPAPRATQPRGRGGAERLSPRFVEWLMGWPDGWVTDVEGLTANEQLKVLGNGVVPQQALLALELLTLHLAVSEVAA